MQWSAALGALSVADVAAVAVLVLAWAIIGWVTDHPPAGRPSVSVLMTGMQREWMAQYVTREARIFDATIEGSLRQGTAFFASTALLAIGGLLALIGNTAPLQGVAAEIGTAPAPAILWQIRLVPPAVLLVHAFLKFVWAHRIFGYGSVLMAAVPLGMDDPRAPVRAAQAAEFNIRGMVNFNAGLRSMYFALGALGWLAGPVALIGGTLVVTWLLWAREFWSRPRDILLGR